MVVAEIGHIQPDCRVSDKIPLRRKPPTWAGQPVLVSDRSGACATPPQGASARCRSVSPLAGVLRASLVRRSFFRWGNLAMIRFAFSAVLLLTLPAFADAADVYEVRIIQVISETEALIQFNQSGLPTLTMWAEMNTKGKVDGASYDIKRNFIIVGTKSYTTSLGAKRTVKHIRVETEDDRAEQRKIEEAERAKNAAEREKLKEKRAKERAERLEREAKEKAEREAGAASRSSPRRKPTGRGAGRSG